ncbi:MAG: hypothetical protein IID61_09025 [SAR324 cluster bacterium]|nr:hypothetical protein [SAR324 cluster bacterium]
MSIENISEIDKILTVIVLLFPGFLAFRIYHLFVPDTSLQTQEKLLNYFAASVFLFPFNFIAAIYVLKFYDNFIILSAGLLLVFIVLPSGFAAIFYFLRTKIVQFGAIHPIPKAWDYIFSLQKPSYIVIQTKDGNLVGGLFGENSFASSYPDNEDIYLEKACYVDQDTGEFAGLVDGSSGMLIKHSECSRIEFFELPIEDNDND